MDSTLSHKSEARYSSRECTPCRQGGFRCGKELPVCVSCRNRMGPVACTYPIVIRDHSRRHVFGVYMDDFDVTRDIDSATPPPGTAPSLIKIDHLQFLLMRLPSLDVCEVLWDAFLDSVYPIYPLIDLEFFWLWHAEFWEAYGNCRDFNAFRPLILKNPSMICLLLAVLCSGAAAAHKDVWADQPLLTEDRHSVIFSLATGGRMALNACAFNDIPALYTITSSLLLDLAVGSPVESSGRKSYIKTMTVAAQRVGINSAWVSDPATQQLCRRLWDHIRWLDAQCCIAIGIASQEPFREELIGDKPRQPPAISDSNGDIAVLLSYARAEVACFEHHIISHVRGIILDDPRTRAYHGLQLEGLNRILHGIKAQMGQLPEWDDLDLVKIDVEWAKSVIDMLSLEAVVVDLVPNVHKSLQTKNQDNWTIFCISANKYLQAYLVLATDTRFERYSWFLSHYRAAFLQCLYLQLIGLSMWPGDGETATTVDEMMQHMENRQTSECEDTETFRKLKTMYVRVLRVN